ncbi:hypothetical protein CDD82_6521 [Ophiocordyceps australis]|uniref:Zn(2)-C6 fungal-type domain-containing protein n=1 Tax=Ophiocordyceps australis TaxID=1399860 RepID=A0A2C5ZR02_9HYPO|nr:hypothetical protein CDD82_6521 [Ophiocordyceps australis]
MSPASDLLRRHAAIHGGAAAVPDSRRGRACDTCHANKTKCDGGPQCSLCAKRGVTCTYGRRDGNAVPRKPSLDRHPKPVSPPLVDFTLSPATVTPVPASQLATPSFCPKMAIQSVLRAVATRVGHPLATPAPPSAVPKSWLTASVESFFTTFHERWPILHAPSLDETTDSVAIVASIIMINSWLHHHRSSSELLMEIHHLLVESSFKKLANDTFDPSRPWPVKMYQVALLNVIFAFESGRASCIKRARHLLSLLVAAMRQNSCFSSDALDRERNTHYPGDFVPWVFSSVEHWKQLAFCTFQIDTYLSLLCNQPALLRREELDLGLTSTFSMWNSYGLHIFFPRHRSEPWSRGAFKMSCLDMTEPQHIPSGILVEDVRACLLGSWNDIWVLQQLRRNRNEAAALRADAISRQLKMCKIRLDTIQDALERPELHAQYTEFLMRAYSGREMPTEPEWRELVLARVYSCLFTARMLLHLLSLHVHADVQTIREAAQITPIMGLEGTSAVAAASTPAASTAAWQRKALQVQEWALSGSSRAALLDALLTWRTYLEAAPGLELRREPADPIVYMALSAAVTVLWAWTTHAVHSCICAPDVAKAEVGAAPLAVDPGPDVEDWLLRGGRGVCLHGVPVCKCNTPAWLARFAEALARGGSRWELGSIAASTCLSKLAFQDSL